MGKLHSIARAASDDMRSRVHFCPETGQIWLHEHRMLLVHAEARRASDHLPVRADLLLPSSNG